MVVVASRDGGALDLGGDGILGGVWVTVGGVGFCEGGIVAWRLWIYGRLRLVVVMYAVWFG